MKRDIGFIIVIMGIISCLVLGILLRGIEEVSVAENRQLEGFPDFSVSSFVETEFQTDVESGMSDQLLFGEVFKAIYNGVKNRNVDRVVSRLKWLDAVFNSQTIEVAAKEIVSMPALSMVSAKSSIRENKERLPVYSTFALELTPRGNNLIEIDETHHLIYDKRTVESGAELFKEKAANYNKLVLLYPELSFSCYYIETDVDVDFVQGTISHDIVENFYSQLDSAIHTGVLYINEPGDYQKFFYKTDHHWDVAGQIQGYKDMIRLLMGETEPLKNIDTLTISDTQYNGYKSRKSGDYSISDTFKIIVPDIKGHQVFIDGIEKAYDHKDAFIKGDFTKDVGINYYAECNGSDYGLVTYTFDQPEKGNLLVFVDSFSNPINALIASHYNNTYYVDFRYYADTYGAAFDFGDFVEANAIDDVLFSGYYFFHGENEFLVTD